MAETVLNGILDQNIDIDIIISAVSEKHPIMYGETSVPLSEFVPYFCEFIHKRLTPTSESQQHKPYYSPRQVEEKKKSIQRSKNRGNSRSNKANVNSKKSARISLSYTSSSSPTGNQTCHDATEDQINGISPIRKHNKSGNTSRRQKTTVLRSNTSCQNQSSFFELSSFDDFPSISSTSSTPCKNPRRITATPVVTSSTPSLKVDGSSQKVFLEESSFESANKDGAHLDKLFGESRRFSLNAGKNKNVEESFWGVSETSAFDSAFKRLGMSSDNKSVIDFQQNLFSQQKQTKDTNNQVTLHNVHDKELLDTFVKIYSTICSENMVTNITLELNFLFTVLTYSDQTFEKEDILSPFLNLAGCIYFACKTVDSLYLLLMLLDMKTQQLLVENARIVEFLGTDFSERMETQLINDASIARIKQNISAVKSPMTGIPFQASSDNRKAFPSDQHFYSFSKRRDLFYALVRLWEENHLDPDWNMRSTLSQKVGDIVTVHGSVNILHQFARLFAAQLLEMCQRSAYDQSDNSSNISDNLILEFKKDNPSKFQNLQNRFTKPTLRHDPCPRPSFSLVEEFFKEFILVADSYCFSKYLIHVFISCIDQRNSKTFELNDHQDLNKSDVSESTLCIIKETILELRILGKFLGFIVFLPYRSKSESEANLLDESRGQVSEPVDIKSYIQRSVKEKRLIMTLPWTVDFFSMADKSAFKVDSYKSSICYIIQLYTHRRMKLCNVGFSVLHFLLLVQLGWLLEQPQFETIGFYQMVDCGQEKLSFQDTNKNGLDDVLVLDRDFLYEICPYLNDVRKPLANFAKGASLGTCGPFRKITTVRTSSVFSEDMSSNVRSQLLDSFVKYLPKHIKDCLNFVTERHFNNIKKHITDNVIPKSAQGVTDGFKDKLSLEVEDFNLESLKFHNQNVFSVHVERGRPKIASDAQSFLKKYLEEKAPLSIVSLLPSDTHQQVINTSCKVVKYSVRIKTQEWLRSSGEIYLNLVETLYTRYLKSVIKTRKEEERNQTLKQCV